MKTPTLRPSRGTSLLTFFEDDRATDTVGEVGAVAHHVRGTVQVVALSFGRDAARELLLGQEPMPDLDRMGGIGEIENHVLVSSESGLVGGEVGVASAGVEVAVRSRPAGVPGADRRWSCGIAHVPHPHARGRGSPGHVLRTVEQGVAQQPGEALPRRVSQQLRRRFLEASEHQAIGDLHLHGRGVCRPGHERQQLGHRWLGHVEHAPAAVPQVRGVEVPTTPDDLKRELERGPAVEVMVANQVEVLREELRGRARPFVGPCTEPKDAGEE